jgi:trimethylamine---corrinoid protein Co-methyltransferase
VTIGGRSTVFAPAYGPPFVTCADRGRRYGTLEDFHNFVKLAYMIPWLHHSGGTVCEPTDIPVNKRHLDMLYAHMTLSDKPFMGSVTTAPRAADSIEMCRILFGADFVDRHCVILGNVNVNSPLVLDGEASRVIRTYAAANQAPVCVPFILGGAMGPVTTAGGLAQCFAEAVFCVALGQLERPGSPAILGNFLSSMSLKERRADLRHARAGARVLRDRPARAPPRRAAALRRQPVRVKGRWTRRRPMRVRARCGRHFSPARISCCTRPAGSRRVSS